MNPKEFPSFLNVVVGMCVLMPSGIILLFMKMLKPRYYRFLILGIIMVIYSAACFRLLGDIQHGIFTDNPWLLKGGPSGLKEMTYTISQNFKAWIYVFPAVIAAIGANLISHFLIMENPRKKKISDTPPSL